jgi:putative membrane-bound dehydrogenase-like protein
MKHLVPILLISLACASQARAGNDFTYLDENNPYWVSRQSPRLTTPQWLGEEGVEAVVLLSIDDMRGHEKYENYLRPILNRLKRIDGRAPVSIMTCQIDPREPHLQRWLKEGLSIEAHTVDHPCPLLQKGDFARAKSTYDRCIDNLAQIPGSKPVAFRMPCCDSLNTPSPRFYQEIFNQTTPNGHHLAIDSSVLTLITAKDPELGHDLVFDPEGRERFRKYLPADRSFVNYIEDYPYPYVIGKKCWEFPCIAPSDWSAQHLHKPNNPLTVDDWKAAIDACVTKQGTFTLIFHPHGWIQNTQIVDLIDHAVRHHGKKVKFLTFKEANERLERNLLGGQSLRTPEGGDNGVRLLDVNNDGYMDVVIGNRKVQQTRLWDPKTRQWKVLPFPVAVVPEAREGWGEDAGVRFGVLAEGGMASCLVRNEKQAGAWRFDGTQWVEEDRLMRGLALAGRPLFTSKQGRDRGVRLHDLDADGICELIVGNERENAVFQLDREGWKQAPFGLPPGTSVVDARGRDHGLRLVDVNEDGHDDVLFSNDESYSLHLFTSMKEGWSNQVLAGKRGDEEALPRFVRKGTDNGAWFHSRHLWVQNEDTAVLKDLVERRSFADLLKDIQPGAKSPAASLRCFQTRPGFTVELMAAEPLVQDPVGFAWGPDGKLWVVEMGDYPSGVDGKGKPGGRVRYLEDTNKDGQYDRSTIFLDNIPFPNGVMPWRDGVLITAAPNILLAKDTDGDGKADRVETLYTGFVEGNQQHRVNGLVWGLDNWIYCANGDSGGKILSLRTRKTINISGRDLRIRPDEGDLDAQTGQTQFGRCRDDWGNWFGGNNSNPLWHFVLPDHYLRRNPHLRVPSLRVTVPEVPGASPVFPISRTLPRFNDPWALNRFTSACSPIFYRDTFFGPAFEGNLFVSEPVHNLVHREVMHANGVTFRSTRPADEQRSEFLASSDNWFRPTTIRVGPDGALWVADMYRHVIEHPKWIPQEWQKKLDLRAGSTRGRIYRVYPLRKKPRAIPRLDEKDLPSLVASLESPSGWERDLAQQMLLWKGEKQAIPLLEKLARTSKQALGRLHALCTLDGLDALSPDQLQHALEDSHPGVRCHAIRLSEKHLSKAPQLGLALLRCEKDRDPLVRLQLALTLGAWPDPRAGQALGRLLLQAQGDPYVTTACLSSVNRDNLDPVLLAVLTGDAKEARGDLLAELLRLANALGQDRALITMMHAVGQPSEGKYAAWQFQALGSLLDHLAGQNHSLSQLRAHGNRELQTAIDELAGLFQAARDLALQDKEDLATRLHALRLLGRGVDHQEEDIALLSKLLVPRSPLQIQAAAIDMLGQLRSGQVPEVLLERWPALSPSMRSRTLEVLLQRQEWVKALLDRMEEKKVLAGDISAAHRQRLLRHPSAEIRKRATRLLEGGSSSDRQKVLARYQPVLSMKGDAKRGQVLFEKHCAVCHHLGEGKGIDKAGPDLGPLAGKPGDYLLLAMLDPNRAVESRYLSYVAELKNGLLLTGVIVEETGSSITLIQADGKKHVLARADLESLSSSGLSAMPEGLEKDLGVQEVADLLAHIHSQKPTLARKEFPGNVPALIQPGAGGILELLATQSEIYGPSLILEAKYRNLGYWSSPEDHAIWTVQVPRAGTYAVWLEWACPLSSSGNAFVLQGPEGKVSAKVASTGSWDRYRKTQVGKITLRAGQQRLTMQSEGVIKGALLDLKSIRLVPE